MDFSASADVDSAACCLWLLVRQEDGDIVCVDKALSRVSCRRLIAGIGSSNPPTLTGRGG